jgi:ApaG protein
MFLEEESTPANDHYVWAYQVQIENLGSYRVQLLSRQWQVRDGYGRLQEIQGEGVIGSQPFVDPGEVFEYTSGIPLSTPSGIMVGSYQMEKEDGEMIHVEIPPFSLDSPHQRVVVH